MSLKLTDDGQEIDVVDALDKGCERVERVGLTLADSRSRSVTPGAYKSIKPRPGSSRRVMG